MIRLLAFALLCTALARASDFRTFTDVEQREVEARPVAVVEDGIVVELRDGRRSTIPLARLSVADREFVRAFAARQGGKPRIWFPEDSGVIDVTQPPYGAMPDDDRDDTTAIQQALEDHPTNNHIFYFPDGVYDLSDALLQSGANQHACLELRGSLKRNIFIGESETGTVLRLMDSVPEDFAKGVIWFGPSPAQRFRNAMRHLTVSIGKGHPNADAVLFNASNQGGLRHVTLSSEDGAGGTGLNLAHTDEIGPLLVQDVTVIGFDRGIRCAFQTASQTFERITLRGQREYGWTNGFAQWIFIRDLDFAGPVTALRSGPTGPGDPGQARTLLVDADLRYTGLAGEAPAAIRNQKAAFFRDIKARNYRSVITRELDHHRGNPTVKESPVDEFIANGSEPKRRGPAFTLFPSPSRSLDLPVEEPPEIAWEQRESRWHGPHQFGGRPDDGRDDTAALQAAIDSGASTVYLPRGTWNLKGDLLLRGRVRHLVGCEARLNPVEDHTARLVLADGTEPAVLVEGLEAGRTRFTHGSTRTLHLRHLLGGRYRAPEDAPLGHLFLTDVTCGPITVAAGQRVWARQLNIEGNTTKDPESSAKVDNDGGIVWILGLKTEDEGTVIHTTGGGRTELLGHRHVGGTGDEPAFVTLDSSLSAAITSAPGFPVAAVETRRGETRRANDFAMADLYSAWSHR